MANLIYCYICKENSIATKKYTRQKDGMKMYFEYCINKNPSCQHKMSREVGLDETYIQKEKKEKISIQEEKQIDFGF